MGSYLVGVDIGGTFTDCVVIDESGAVTTAKAPSTPGNFAQGMIDAILGAADEARHRAGAALRAGGAAVARHHGRHQRRGAEARRAHRPHHHQGP